MRAGSATVRPTEKVLVVQLGSLGGFSVTNNAASWSARFALHGDRQHLVCDYWQRPQVPAIKSARATGGDITTVHHLATNTDGAVIFNLIPAANSVLTLEAGINYTHLALIMDLTIGKGGAPISV